jgi:hypothetical protein
MTETVQTIENLMLYINKEAMSARRSAPRSTPCSSRWVRTMKRPKASHCP